MSDQKDFENLSRRLAGIDFSADSRIRARLRVELLKKQGALDAAPRSFPARVAPLVLAMASITLLLLLPFRAKLHRAAVPTHVTIQARLPDAPSLTPTALPRSPAPRRLAFPRGELGLPILPGRLVVSRPPREEAPISTRPIDRLIDIHQGRVIPRKNGSAVLWRIDGTDYMLETRRISLNDIFEIRAL